MSSLSTIKLSHDVADLPSRTSETLFKGRMYPMDKCVLTQTHADRYAQRHNRTNRHNTNTISKVAVLSPEQLDDALNTLVPSSLLTLSSPKSCKHILNLSKQLITSTSSSYPTVLLQLSADDYCVKRSNELGLHPKNILPHPVMCASYRYLDIGDILISVSHCHNCSKHNMTLNHKEHEYIKHADEVIRQTVRHIHELSLKVRVGVIRTKSQSLGALEVQVVSNTVDQGIQIEVLHSKIATKRWPSKSVVKKRLLSFINKQTISRYDGSDYTSSQQNGERYDGLAMYPIGHISSFEDLPMSDSKWSYESVRNEAILAGRLTESEYSDSLLDDITVDGKFVNVIYAYDSRQVGSLQKGCIVEVNDILNPRGCLERHPFIGEVLQIDDRFLSVQLKYFVSPTRHYCDSVKLCQSNQRPESEALDEIPAELETLFLIARRKVGDGFNLWEPLDEGDKEVDGVMYLTRNSLFHQLRNLVYDIELQTSMHSHGAPVDLQLCYSERILDWIFDYLGDNENCINVYKLELVVGSRDLQAFENEMKKIMVEGVEAAKIEELVEVAVVSNIDIGSVSRDDDAIYTIISEMIDIVELIYK